MPLATICVPTSTPAGAWSKRRSTSRIAPRPGAASASSRKTGSGRPAPPGPARAAPSPRRGGPPTPSRSPGRRTAPARCGRSGGRPPGPRAVQHQRDVALRALPHAAARPAGEEVRPAAAVEQDDRLLAAVAPPASSASRGPRVQRPSSRPSRPARPAAAPARPRAPASTAGRAAPSSPAAVSRCRPAARRRLLGGALLGHPAGVVARVALLLVRPVVLLVDHDQAQVGERREHGRPRPDAHARLAARRRSHSSCRSPAPSLECRTRPRRRSAARSAPRSAASARSPAPARSPSAALQAGGDGLQVDLGLAAAGDAVQQHAPVRVAGGVDARHDPLERRRLRRASARPAAARAPTPDRSGRERSSPRSIATSPRLSSARTVACPAPVARVSPATLKGPPSSAASAAALAAAEPGAVHRGGIGRRGPAGVRQRREQRPPRPHRAVRAGARPRRQHQRQPRAGVEQYSSAT